MISLYHIFVVLESLFMRKPRESEVCLQAESPCEGRFSLRCYESFLNTTLNRLFSNTNFSNKEG